MTLNIDLEEVPFAILEAVKARILANRRRLQDQQRPRPSLRPRPQFVKIGANSKSWRLPKPAAMVLEDGAVLLITWDGINPVLSDPQAVQLRYDPVRIRSTTLNGVAAIANDVGTSSFFDGSHETTVRPDGTEDFTLESWGEFSSSDITDSDARIWTRLIWLAPDGSTRYLEVEGRYFPNGFTGTGLFQPVAPGFYITGSLPNNTYVGPVKVSESPLSPFHLCAQRIDGNHYFYINGNQVLSSITSNRVVLQMPATIEIRFYLDSNLIAQPNKLGQIRLTVNRARYSQAGFTPDPLPFADS